MAKLYWRVKRDGKWTWVPAESSNTLDEDGDQWLPILSYNDVHHQQVMEDDVHHSVMEEEDDPSEDYCRAVEEEE